MLSYEIPTPLEMILPVRPPKNIFDLGGRRNLTGPYLIGKF
jgi:hypothetical protein